jgi:hypothetical protein
VSDVESEAPSASPGYVVVETPVKLMGEVVKPALLPEREVSGTRARVPPVSKYTRTLAFVCALVLAVKSASSHRYKREGVVVALCAVPDESYTPPVLVSINAPPKVVVEAVVSRLLASVNVSLHVFCSRGFSVESTRDASLSMANEAVVVCDVAIERFPGFGFGLPAVTLYVCAVLYPLLVTVI